MDGIEAELELMARCTAGEQLALERLLLRHHDRLAAVVARKLPDDVRGLVGAEDVLQQAYTVAFRRVREFQPRGPDSFFYWLAAIAENVLLELVRAQRALKRGGGRAAQHRSPAGGDETVGALIDALSAQENTPSRAAATEEARAAVREGLEDLPDEYRVALRLRYLDGLSVQQAADQMNRTPRAMHMLCYRGLRRLREILGRSSQFFSERA